MTIPWTAFYLRTQHAPAYLQNPDIRIMFNRFLDSLDDIPSAQRTNSILRIVSSKHFPRLFEPDEPDDDAVSWKLILRCQANGLITRSKTDIFVQPELLERPVFAGTGKSPEQIISRLATIPALVKERPLTARHLSALLFWGDSKVLDHKEQWLCNLLGLPQGVIAERMLPVDVTFSSRSPAGVLMLENLDSYFSACDENWPDCDNFVKIYFQGFRGTAARIRNPACAH